MFRNILFCENNNYTGALKFNTIFGELYIQVRKGKIFIDHKVSIKTFESDLINVLKEIKIKMKVASFKSELEETEIDLLL